MSNFNTVFNTLIVHHSQDMDGLTSQVIADVVFNQNDTCMTLSYDYYNDENIIDDYINKLSNDETKHIIFIDVTASETWYQNNINKPELKVTIIDHHFSKLDSIFKAVYGDKNELKESSESIIDYMYDGDTNFGIFYSANSATKTLEMFSELSIKTLRECGFQHVFNFNRTSSMLYGMLINYVDFYDVWKWERVVIEQQKILNDMQYNLYYLSKHIQRNNGIQTNLPSEMVNAINAYMFNYSMNKTFKKVREIDTNLLSKIGFINGNNAYDELHDIPKYKFSANPEFYPTELMIDYINNQCIIENNFDGDNFIEIIEDGYNQYIKDYEEVETFFSTHPNINNIVQEVHHKGFHYVIVNYKFSNVIRDYFYNNYVGINFILLPRFEGDKFKVTGRTIKQNTFNVGELMKQKYNGGGHFNAGGGTIKKDKIDIEKLNHSEIVNDFIDNFYTK